LTVAGLVERFHELRADVSDRSALVW
jgi:hypothetical protein